MGLRGQTLQGMVWTGTSYAVRFGVQMALAAFLARLLTPTDFGIVAMTSVVVTFLAFFRGQGVGQAISMEQEPTQAQLSSAFWYTLAAGILMGGVIAAVSPLAVLIYGESRVAPVFLFAGLSVALGSTAGVHGGLLSRQMRFKTLAARDITGQIVGGVVGVVLAWQGFGFYALALQSVVAAVYKSIFLWTASEWRPSFVFDWGSFRGLLKFGSNVTGFQVFNHIASNIDQFILATFLGPAELAFYRQGGMVARMPSQAYQQVATKVMLPALAKVREARQAGIAVLESTRLACGVLFLPFAAALALAAEIVVVLYGGQWDRSAFIVQAFALLAFPQILALNIGWLYKSRGRPELQLRFAFIAAPVRVASILLGMRWGLEGVVIALILSGFGLMPLLHYPLALAELRWRDVLWSLRGVLAATVAALVLMAGLRLVLIREGLHEVAILLACGLAGALVYAGLLWLLDRRLWREGFQFLRDMRAAKEKGAVPGYVLARMPSPTEGPASMVPDPAGPPGGPPRQPPAP
ncbi:MAG: lipopolysaccharide biosynthesis protein [Thermoplasmatota archaeon]